MFEDIDLTIGEVLPSGSVDEQALAGTFQSCTDACSCFSPCCRTTAVCC